MDITSAYREVGTYRGAAEMCGTTHKTVRRTVEQAEAGEVGRAKPGDRPHNCTGVTDVVATRGRLIVRADLGEAVDAGRSGGRVCRVGAELPPAGRRSEEVVAAGSPPRSPAGGVGAGRISGV